MTFIHLIRSDNQLGHASADAVGDANPHMDINAGLASLTVQRSQLPPGLQPQHPFTMVNLTILAGGYTAYITAYLFNTDDNSLTYLNQYKTGGNPSWIISHPTNKGIL